MVVTGFRTDSLGAYGHEHSTGISIHVTYVRNDIEENIVGVNMRHTYRLS